MVSLGKFSGCLKKLLPLHITHSPPIEFTLLFFLQNVQFMEDCNIVIMNLGLHYDSRGEMYGLNYQSLIEDTFAAFTYLANFTSQRDDRIGIWRSALPQHFDTSSGNYITKELDQVKNKTCVPLKDPKSKQPYNDKYEEAFSILCSKDLRIENNPMHLECNDIWQSCTVNVTSRDYYTVYSYWLRNNLTDDIEAFKRRNENEMTTGKIYRWNIFDLFNVPTWHAENSDCTHFCFVASMYEAAFHRLDLLLSAFTSL